jgi:hypothetical protein
MLVVAANNIILDASFLRELFVLRNRAWLACLIVCTWSTQFGKYGCLLLPTGLEPLIGFGSTPALSEWIVARLC